MTCSLPLMYALWLICCVLKTVSELNAINFTITTIISDVGVKRVFCGEVTCENIIKFPSETLTKCRFEESLATLITTVKISDGVSLNDCIPLTAVNFLQPFIR